MGKDLITLDSALWAEKGAYAGVKDKFQYYFYATTSVLNMQVLLFAFINLHPPRSRGLGKLWLSAS